MALSADEKEARSVATNSRNRAYHARWKERDAAEQRGEQEIKARYDGEMSDADAAEGAIRQDERARCAEIDRQIDALKAQRESIVRECRRRYDAARAVSQEIWNRRDAEMRQLQERLNERFPDMTGAARYSAACWKPISEFTEDQEV